MPRTDSNWNEKLNQVKAFAEENNRWPSTTSQSEEENKLAQWWSRSKYQLKKESISQPKAEQVREIISEFSQLERQGVWETRLLAVRERIDSNGKLWTYKNCTPEELQNLRWFNQQKTFVKKFRAGAEKFGGMTENRAREIEHIIHHMGMSNNNSNKEAQVEEISLT